MNNFVFENSTKVFLGKNCVEDNLANLLKNYGENILLAYGGGSIKKNGIYDTVMKILIDLKKNVIEFSGIMPNPTYEKVLEGASLVKDNKIDLILAVGGGSTMDCAKAVSLASVYEGDMWDDFWEKAGEIAIKPIPLGVIVTVAGTGSECNGGAVITNEKKKIKTGRDYPRLNPKFALLDPEYTFSVSKFQTASGGFDILSHVMETYFSLPDDDNISDGISEVVMKSVIKNLPKAIENPTDYEARSNLMWASTMGENRIIKLGKKCDFQVHQIEHQLGAYTDCNHGLGLAIIHPTYYKHIYKNGLSKFVRFAKNVWDVDVHGKTDEEVALLGIKKLEEFIQKIGLGAHIRDIGINDKNILSEIAASCNVSAGSYGDMSKDKILKILNECF